MKIIGLTGPSGSGKSTLCHKFEELKIPCINTDEIYHSITSAPSPCLDELKAKFGEEIIDSKGGLDRKKLASIVFEGEHANENLASLNATTHKHIWIETNKVLTKHKTRGIKAAVIDAPALFSSKIFLTACDIIISVLCDKELRLERIIKRDGISREQALARMNAQPSDAFFTDNSDYVIVNRGTPREMSEELLSILHQEEIIIK